MTEIKKYNSKESKNWIYVQQITSQRKRILFRIDPWSHEIVDGINLANPFSQYLLWEDNAQLRLVLYENGKSIRRVSHISIQLVCTCLLLNWDLEQNSSPKEIPTSFIELAKSNISSRQEKIF